MKSGKLLSVVGGGACGLPIDPLNPGAESDVQLVRDAWTYRVA